MTWPTLLLVLAGASCDPPPAPEPAVLDTGECGRRCEAAVETRTQWLTDCGVPLASTEVECTAENVIALECEVACIDRLGDRVCRFMTRSATYVYTDYAVYYDCVAACPPRSTAP